MYVHTLCGAQAGYFCVKESGRSARQLASAEAFNSHVCLFAAEPSLECRLPRDSLFPTIYCPTNTCGRHLGLEIDDDRLFHLKRESGFIVFEGEIE